MRFVFISTMSGHRWGGSEELWSQAALRLHEEGHEVSASVVWWPQLSPNVLALKERGIKLSVRKLPRHHAAPLRAWHTLKRQFNFEAETAKWLRRQRPDLIVVSQGGNLDGLECMKFCREANLPFVSIVQCNYEEWWPADDTWREMVAVYRAAKQVFCVSRHNLELLENQIGEPLPQAAVVWNPFNVPAGQPPVWPAEINIWKLACVARLEPAAKGQDLLFQVLSRPQWQDRPVELNLYGAGPGVDNLKRLIGKLNLKKVYLRGHVNDVKAIWEQNHLLVLPSRYEGLPLALVEAMWCGRPAVVTDVGGSAEICADGETGFVAAAPTVDLVGAALERAWNRRDDWQRIGQAARARVEQLIPKNPVLNFCQQLMAGAENEK